MTLNPYGSGVTQIQFKDYKNSVNETLEELKATFVVCDEVINSLAERIDELENKIENLEKKAVRKPVKKQETTVEKTEE